jgi:hypothetical protein
MVTDRWPAQAGATWNIVASLPHILGIKPELTGLRVHLCIGVDVLSFMIVRTCRVPRARDAPYGVTMMRQGVRAASAQARSSAARV